MDGMLCGLDAADEADCQLSSPATATSTTTTVTLPGTFKALAPGDNVVCGLSMTNEAVCVQTTDDAEWQSPPAGATFQSLACGVSYCCGIASSGNILCWGDPADVSRVAPPAGTYSAIAAAVIWPAAQRPDGTLALWGSGWRSEDMTTMAFGKFCIGYDFGCGIGSDGKIACFGFDVNGVGNPPTE
jgi:hypothetical protein